MIHSTSNDAYNMVGKVPQIWSQEESKYSVHTRKLTSLEFGQQPWKPQEFLSNKVRNICGTI